jgi:hypothetical protein
VHLTKRNLQGEGAFKYMFDGKRVGYFEYVLKIALKHYGGDINDAQIRLVSGIEAADYNYQFRDPTNSYDKQFPGWAESGFLTNISDTNWKSGDVANPDDIFALNMRGISEWQIQRAIAGTTASFTAYQAINAADQQNGHSSNTLFKRHIQQKSQDIYVIGQVVQN